MGVNLRAALERLALTPRAAAPADPMPGELWSNDATGRLLAWRAGQWRQLAEAGDAPTAHVHSANDINDGVLALNRLPVAPSGNSNATQVVRADDARLSDARTPTSHVHDDRYFTETESDARFAGLVHVHDDRYFTETEADARFPRKSTLTAVGVATWIRVASVNGGSATGGGNISLLISGQGTYSSPARCTDLVHFGQRGDNIANWEAWRFGTNSSPWQYLIKQVSTYVFELWARRPAFDPLPTVTIVGAHNGTLLLDSAATSLPAGLTALDTPKTVAVDTVARGAFHVFEYGATSPSIGDFTFGDSAGKDLTGRRVRLTASGHFSPPAAGTGVAIQFHRQLNGGAWTALGVMHYWVAPNMWAEGFTIVYTDTPPAGTVAYRVRVAGHYQHGSTLAAGTQFTAEDVGAAV